MNDPISISFTKKHNMYDDFSYYEWKSHKKFAVALIQSINQFNLPNTLKLAFLACLFPFYSQHIFIHSLFCRFSIPDFICVIWRWKKIVYLFAYLWISWYMCSAFTNYVKLNVNMELEKILFRSFSVKNYH